MNFLALFLLHIITTFSLNLYAGNLAIIGMGKESDKNIVTLKERTGKYDNDNTFVHLYSAKTNVDNIRVANKNVVVSLPSRLNYDTLMEILFKIRAARTFGAREISVSLSHAIKDVILSGALSEQLVLEDLLANAGADFLIENNIPRATQEKKPTRNKITEKDYWIGGSNHPTLLHEIADHTNKHAFSFEELLNLKAELKNRKIYWVSASTFPINDNFFTTLAQIQWLTAQGAVVHLISPYLPYARSDKPEFDVGSTTQGRVIADLIEAAGTWAITVVRAHAPQSLGFFKIASSELSGRSTIIEYLKSQNVDCIVAPDAGFQKDATKYQQELSKAYGDKSVCLAVMNKQRDSNGQETIVGGTGLEQIAKRRVVIIDDETATGGTLYKVSDMVQAYGPTNIFAMVTHLAGPAEKILNAPFITSLIVTNTVPVTVSNSKLKILSIAHEIAQEIIQIEN